QVLFTAPLRSSASRSSVVISLPNQSGKFEKFEMYEASNFEPVLQAQFPQIRSYVGVGLDDKTAVLRLSLDPRGIQTMVLRADKKTEFIEPYSEDGAIVAVYKSSRNKGKLPFTCSTPDQDMAIDLSRNANTTQSSTGVLLNFRLALSCNGEYANYFNAFSSADVALVLAAFNSTMTRVNGVFEKDFAIHMDIVSQSTNVIYYNPATDPYSATLGNWNVELQNTLSTSLTGPSTSLAANNAAYDVGHMFGATGGGGNAGCIGCVCRDDTSSTTDRNKGAGITSPADGVPAGDAFDIDYVAHELGHQFGANHTFSHASEGTGVNKEVGSGVTVMGYAGITAQDTHSNSIEIFHSASIAQVQANMATKTCPTSTTITHSAPVVNAGIDYTIPRSTPFMLTGSATDAGGTSTLTYTWEQNDDVNGNTGTASAASETKTSGPNWVNYIDSASPTRYFPRMSSVLTGSRTTAGVDVTAEALSSVARTLNFRLTARDKVLGQGQTNFDDMVVTVDGTRGPLTVTSQNTDGITWMPGASQTITWNVNNTNTSFGGANVDILLSTDNGATFSTVLVANTPNDGSETITVPNILEPFCRIMVKASGSIFFNVNLKNISIGYVVTTTTTCTDYSRTFSPPVAMQTNWAGYGIPAPGVAIT
ncbi:MAG: reprolysin-like metallopeptidase, partial [Candidatus Sericytochromatia bacterium]